MKRLAPWWVLFPGSVHLAVDAVADPVDRLRADRYLHPLGFDGGALGSAVCDMSGTDRCSAPRQVLSTPELLWQGAGTLTAAPDIVAAVENRLAVNPGAFDAEHPLTVRSR